MRSHFCNRSMFLPLIVCLLSLQGCNRAGTDKVTPAPQSDVTASSSEEQLEQEAGSSKQSSASRTTPETSASPTRTDIPISPSVHIDQADTSRSISSGYFDGKHDTVISSTPHVEKLSMSPDGRYTVVGRRINTDGSLLQVWDIQSRRLVKECHEPLGVTSITFSPDSQILAYGTRDRTVVLQPLPQGKVRRWQGHRLSIGGLDFSPDGKKLASLGHDNHLFIWDVETGKLISQAIDGEGRFASDVKFVTPDRLWTLGSDDKIRWYNFKNNSLVFENAVDLPQHTWFLAADDEKLFGRLPDHSLHVIAASTGKDLMPPPFQPDVSEKNTLKPSQKLTTVAVASQSHDFAFTTAEGILTFGSQTKQAQTKTIKLDIPLSALATDQEGRLWVAATGTGELLVIRRDQPSEPRWLEKHASDGPVVAPRFNSDDNTLVSLVGANSIIRTDIETGLVQKRMTFPESNEKNNKNYVTTVLGDRYQIYCGTSVGKVEVLDLKSSTLSSTIPVSGPAAAITSLAMAPDGKQLLAGDAVGNTVWFNPEDASPPVSQQAHKGRVRAATFSPDGQWAATAGEGRTIVIWDVDQQSKRSVLKGHQGVVQALAFSPDSRWLISGDRQGELILWDAQQGKQVWNVKVRAASLQSLDQSVIAEAVKKADVFPDQGITAFAFNSDQHVLAVGTVAGYLQTFDLVNFRELSTVFTGGPVSDLKFADDSTSLLISIVPGEVIRCWQSPKPPRMLSGHEGYVRFAALDESGLRAVTGGHDKQLCIWDVNNRKLIQSLDNGEVISAGALSPDGSHAVTVGFGSGVVFWDLDQMKRIDKRYGHKARVWSLDFAPDGKQVASGSEDTSVRIWDVATRKTRLTLPHDSAVRFVKFSPDGKKLLSSTRHERGWKYPAQFQLWDSITGKLLVEFKGHRSSINGAVFSEDGSGITSCGADSQVCRWNASTGQLLNNITRRNGLSHISSLRGSPFLVMLRFNNGVFIDDAGSLKRLSEFNVPTRTIGDLNVSSKSNRIIAGTQEGRVFVWSIGGE